MRHPCFDFATEGGKRIFNTNESKTPNRRETRRQVAYFANSEHPQFIELRPLTTAHKFGAPSRVPTSLRGGTLFSRPPRGPSFKYVSGFPTGFEKRSVGVSIPRSIRSSSEPIDFIGSGSRLRIRDRGIVGRGHATGSSSQNLK